MNKFNAHILEIKRIRQYNSERKKLIHIYELYKKYLILKSEDENFINDLYNSLNYETNMSLLNKIYFLNVIFDIE